MISHLLRSASALLAGVMLISSATAQNFNDRREVQFSTELTNDTPQRLLAVPRDEGFNGTMVLRGGRIFDSIKDSAYPGTLVIRHNLIVGVLPPTSTDWPADAKVIDVSGKTVMPGLIDMHVHVYSPNAPGLPPGTPQDFKGMEGFATLRGLENLRHALENGITSVRDQGGLLNTSFILSEWLGKDMVPGPRVFTAGHIITGTGGHMAERIWYDSPNYARQANGADDWRLAVREAFKMGASHIKIASHFAPDEVKAAVEEAHRLGLRVTCDCETIYISMAVEAGVDSIEHPLPRADATIRMMAKKGIASVPTMHTYQDLFDTVHRYTDSPSRRFSMNSQTNWDVFKRLSAAGVKMGIGTDSWTPSFAQAPNFYIAEMKFFQKLGYSPAKVLITATRTNSEILDMADKLGTLAPGKLADVIVVNGKPDLDLDDMAKVETVIRNGNIVIEDGRLYMPRYVPVPLAKPSPPDDLK